VLNDIIEVVGIFTIDVCYSDQARLRHTS